MQDTTNELYSTTHDKKSIITRKHEKNNKSDSERQLLFCKLANMWSRVHVISSLTSLQNYWPRLVTNIHQCVE